MLSLCITCYIVVRLYDLSKYASMHGGLGNVSMVDGFIFVYCSPPFDLHTFTR